MNRDDCVVSRRRWVLRVRGEGETVTDMQDKKTPGVRKRRANVPTAIVGPNPLLCESLSRTLHDSAFEIVGMAPHIDELNEPVLKLLPAQPSALLIIDARDRPADAVDQIEFFRRSCPEGRIVVLANRCEPGDVTSVFRSGANAYFSTIATCEDFIKSLELVMQGQTILPSEGMSHLHNPGPVASIGSAQDAGRTVAPRRAIPPHTVGTTEAPGLSKQEQHILRCLAEGSANKVIARDCKIAEGTVKVHVKAILRKIKVQNRTQAAIWALNNRSLVWSAGGGPSVAPDVNVKLASRTTSPPSKSYNLKRGRGSVSGRTHEIRCVAGTDVTVKTS